jgi:serine O-acetyltransferase
MIDFSIFVLFNASVSGSSKIDRTTTFEHNGMGVVVNKGAVIGKRCSIGVHVVIGGRGLGKPGLPRLGNDVVVGAGAKILGAITIGDGAIIGANAVVLHDVPANALAVGVPAEIKRR